MAPTKTIIAQREMPHDLMCPISYQIFQDPVATPCSHTFSRAAIERWIDKQGEKAKCPCCKGPISQESLQKNEQKASEVSHFLDPIVHEILEHFKDKPVETILETSKHEYGEALLVRLKKRLALNADDEDVKRALEHAIQEGDEDAFDALIDCGASLDALVDNYPLIVKAVKSGNEHLLHKILNYFFDRLTTSNHGLNPNIFLQGVPQWIARLRRDNPEVMPPSTEVPNLACVLPRLSDQAAYDYLSMPPIFMRDRSSLENQDALSAALSLNNDRIAALIFSLGLKTIHKRDNGEYHDITQTQDPEKSIVNKVTTRQLDSWCVSRACNYIFEKRQMIHRYQQSHNIFLKIWGFLLQWFNQRKIQAARSLYICANERKDSRHGWRSRDVQRNLKVLTSGDLGRTVFRPYLQYSLQKGLFSIQDGETLESAWFRNLRERKQAANRKKAQANRERSEAETLRVDLERQIRALPGPGLTQARLEVLTIDTRHRADADMLTRLMAQLVQGRFVERQNDLALTSLPGYN